MVFSYFRNMIYISLLLTNAVAILNEERFLAKIGWSAKSAQTTNSGFGQVPANPNLYDSGGFGNAASDGPSIKMKLVTLISATRTLMRIPLIALNIIIIFYEILLG